MATDFLAVSIAAMEGPSSSNRLEADTEPNQNLQVKMFHALRPHPGNERIIMSLPPPIFFDRNKGSK